MKLAVIILECMEKNLFLIADLIAKFHSWVYILDVMRFFYFVKRVPSNTNKSQQLYIDLSSFHPSSFPFDVRPLCFLFYALGHNYCWQFPYYSMKRSCRWNIYFTYIWSFIKDIFSL